jgi:hypothetical protein
MKKFLCVSIVLLLSACAGGGKDYEASARCQELGKQPGTKDYENCLKEEQALRLYKQQQELERRQDERRQQEIMRRY